MNTARQTNHHAPHSNLTEMYPGIYRPGNDSTSEYDGPNLPTGPLNTLLGFELETYQIPLDQLLPSKKVPDGVMSTRKYKQIVSSINEVGLIEPLSVIQPDRKKPEYLVLDGHLRVLALKELGMSVGPCLFAKDDESYSYNHHVNRLSTIAEHYMIRRAIDRGVSKERLARAFNVNLSSINRRINLLEGICPEAITLLQDKQFTPDVSTSKPAKKSNNFWRKRSCSRPCLASLAGFCYRIFWPGSATPCTSKPRPGTPGSCRP